MSESSSSAGNGESGNELWAPPFPADLLPHIVERLNGADHAALRATCRSWRAIFSAFPPSLCAPMLPFLLVPPRFALPDPLCLSNRTPPHPLPLPDYPLGPIVPFPRLDHGHTDSPIFPLDSLRNPTFRPLPSLSDTARHVCVGCSHGWLILLGPTSHISLLNPLTAATIPLPPPLSSISRYAFPLYDDDTVDRFVFFQDDPPRRLRHLAALVRLAALSADPADDPSSFILVLVLGNTVCCRFFTCGPSDGYAAWKPQSHQRFPAYGVTDLIFHHGLCFAAVTWRPLGLLVVGPLDSIAVFDFHANPAFQRFRNIRIEENLASRSYVNFFAESAGELLLISRHGEITAGRVLVHRLPSLEGDGQLVPTPVASIGDRALFLGTGNTVAVHAPDFPLSVRRNSIYFTDVYRKVVNNQFVSVGCVYVFDMEQGVITKVIEVAETDETNMWVNLRPWWVTPNLRRRDP